MSVFTDEDLRRLKDELGKQTGSYNICLNTLYFGTLNALLARLESAEAVCQQAEIYITKDTPKMFRFKELLEAWWKACGKQANNR